MHVKDCPKCGGTHWGSYVCPFTDEQIAKMGITNVHTALGTDRPPGRRRIDRDHRVSTSDDL